MPILGGVFTLFDQAWPEVKELRVLVTVACAAATAFWALVAGVEVLVFEAEDAGKLGRENGDEELDELDEDPANKELKVCVTACSAASTSCAACALVVEVPVDEFEVLLPVVPGILNRFEDDEFDESDELLENSELSVWVTTCSAASTSCAA